MTPAAPSPTVAAPPPPILPPDAPRAPAPTPAQGLPNTDLDRARRFAEWLDGDARFIDAFGQWAAWDDDDGWNMDDSGKGQSAIFRKAAEFADSLMDEANGYPPGPPRDAAQVVARKAFSSDAMSSMIKLTKSFSSVAAKPWDFDSDPWLLGVQNGVIDLRTNKFRDTERDDMIVKKCSIDFNPKAECPMWKEFLEQVLPDKDVREFVQRAMGYTLTGLTNEQVLFFFYGTGQNGKSTFIETVEKLLGDYHWHTNASMFLETKSDENKDNAFANLPEKRFVVGAEMPEYSRLAENRIKDLSGGDTVYARKLYCEAFNFKPTHKLFLYGNHKPVVAGTDIGIWRRLLLIPFETEISEEKRDRGIVKRLWSESEGILNWCLKGCQMWQKAGRLNPPTAVVSATREYQEAEDLIMQFVEQECEMTGEIQSAILSSNFTDWMKAAGFKWSPSPRAVVDRVRRLPGVRRRKSNGAVFWTGIRIKDGKAYQTR